MDSDSREVLRQRFQALSRIQGHRQIKRGEAHPAGFRVMKSAAGKALK